MIQIKNLKKSFGKAQILNGVNLEVKKGKSQVIIGRSGTGKSILLKCILGLENYDDGTITINNSIINTIKNIWI